MNLLLSVKRSFDPAPFNAIANEESVRTWLGGEGRLDLTNLVRNPANVSFLSQHGGFICQKIGDSRYEVHSLFLPEGRGGEAKRAMGESMAFMFAATDCTELITKCPDNNAAALGLARLGGFEEQFRREKCWPFEGKMVGASYQALPIARWIARSAECLERGHWFHEKLEAAKASAQSMRIVHEDDEAHDRAVGASVLMALAGNPRKAVWAYNRWAVFAGYQPATLLSDAPVLIDVVDAIVAPSGDDMEILLCR